jgi:hypothetical protein
MNKTQRITYTALFLAIALIVQLLRFPQPITGPAINAVLLLSTMLVGPWEAIFIGCLTPGIAWVFGIIPPVLGPLIPFIILANVLLIVIFYQIYRLTLPQQSLFPTNNSPRFRFSPLTIMTAGVGLAALVKFSFLFFITRSFLNYLYQIGWIKVAIPAFALLAFQLPQLYSALAGGFLAMVIYGYLQKSNRF